MGLINVKSHYEVPYDGREVFTSARNNPETL